MDPLKGLMFELRSTEIDMGYRKIEWRIKIGDQDYGSMIHVVDNLDNWWSAIPLVLDQAKRSLDEILKESR